MKLLEQVSLAPFTTLGVGGPARYFVEAASEADVREALIFAKERDLPLFVLGGGSNLVVADAGYPGLVLKISLLGVESRDEDRSFRSYQVAAGEDWDAFVGRAVGEDCAGVECLSGIPGTVGGTPVQNVGAYGQDVQFTIRNVTAMDRQSFELRQFHSGECEFGYRTSLFNSTLEGRYVILGVEFSLWRGGRPYLVYPELRKMLGPNARPSLQQTRDAVLQLRRSKSMVLDPCDENSRSAGSFFKNPVVPFDQYAALDDRLRARGLTLPSHAVKHGWRKLSAAWLVEHAGFAKGYSRGGAGISSRHTLAIINRGGATAVEIVALKDEIQLRVLAEFGISLQLEPVFLGF
jgi:UDP-N-acetylmuramate dehydrogenase